MAPARCGGDSADCFTTARPLPTRLSRFTGVVTPPSDSAAVAVCCWFSGWLLAEATVGEAPEVVVATTATAVPAAADAAADAALQVGVAGAATAESGVVSVATGLAGSCGSVILCAARRPLATRLCRFCGVVVAACLASAKLCRCGRCGCWLLTSQGVGGAEAERPTPLAVCEEAAAGAAAAATAAVEPAPAAAVGLRVATARCVGGFAGCCTVRRLQAAPRGRFDGVARAWTATRVGRDVKPPPVALAPGVTLVSMAVVAP
jgi:hypothetical protein